MGWGARGRRGWRAPGVTYLDGTDVGPTWSLRPATLGRTSIAGKWAGLAAVLPAWVVARVAVGFGLVLARVATDQLGVVRPPSLRDGLAAWDADAYRRIADFGYDAVEHGHRFFPLFPLLVRVARLVTFDNTTVATVVVANVCAVALGVLLYRLMLAETGDVGTARLATWLALAGPAATPLVMGYAEALGTAAAIAGFLAARQRRWGLAATAGVVVGLTWSIGVLFMVPMAFEASRHLRTAARRQQLARAGAVLAPAAATALYLLWVEVTAGGWYERVYRVQATVYDRSLRDPLSRLVEMAYDLAVGHHAEGIALPWALTAIVLVVVAFRRLPGCYGAWSAVVVLVALSAENVDSFERYVMRAFPLVMVAALGLRAERDRWMAISIALAGLVVYSTAIFLGAEVP